MKIRSYTLKQVLPFILLIGGIIGVLCAGVLTMDKIELLKFPNRQLTCDINPVVACGSVINTPQASAFGFLNPLIGLAGFGGIAVVGAAMLAGGVFKRWFWIGVELGVLFGVGFVTWLQFQSLYRINALCPYCMVVWVVMITMFWYTTLYTIREGHIVMPPALKNAVSFAGRHHADILIFWFLVLVALILQHFWYYWSTIL